MDFYRERGAWVGVIASLIILVATWALYERYQGSAMAFIEMHGDHRFIGAVLFACIMCIATVCAPITALPLIPSASFILGPFYAGTASIIGWWIGAGIAFGIARYGGRPFLLRFVDLRKMNTWESRLPRRLTFAGIVALRMVVPVDVLSYALGLLSTVSFRDYMGATLIGITWFGYAFAYGGSAALTGNYVLFMSIGVASGIVLLLALWYIRYERTR